MKKIISLIIATIITINICTMPVNAAEYSVYYLNQWIQEDGDWYYLDESSSFATNQYIDGYWVGDDGRYYPNYDACWKSDSIGWWYESINGWYPQNEKIYIDGICYWFNADGYVAGFLCEQTHIFNAVTDEVIDGDYNGIYIKNYCQTYNSSKYNCGFEHTDIKVYILDRKGNKVYGYVSQ